VRPELEKETKKWLQIDRAFVSPVSKVFRFFQPASLKTDISWVAKMQRKDISVQIFFDWTG
jgi:hypothetical protein